MFRFAAFLGAALLFAQDVTAADIRWKSELSKPGDYVTIDQSQDGRVHHVFTGRSGSAFVTKSYRGRKPRGTPWFTTYLDKDGNYLLWVRSDGFQIRYKPHDCTRTLGKCAYTEVHSDGTTRRRTRATQRTRSGLAFKEFDEKGQFLFGGVIEIDARGWAGNGVIDGNQGTQRFKLIARRYQ